MFLMGSLIKFCHHRPVFISRCHCMTIFPHWEIFPSNIHSGCGKTTPDGQRDETTFSTIKNYISTYDVYYRGNSIHDETIRCYLNIDWYITGLVIVVVLYYSTSLFPSIKLFFSSFFSPGIFFFSVCATRSFGCCCMACRGGKIAERCHASEKNVMCFPRSGENFFSISFI